MVKGHDAEIEDALSANNTEEEIMVTVLSSAFEESVDIWRDVPLLILQPMAIGFQTTSLQTKPI